MRRIVLHWTAAVLVCLTCAAAHAQQIYVLAVGDTSEKGSISFSTGPDLQYVFDAFYANVPAGRWVMYNFPLDDAPGGEMHAPWEGPDVRGDLVDMKDKILTAIDRCPAGPNDTIVVFYTGHGAADEVGHFLVMPDGETRLHRKTILERMAKKQPRLAVLITDACNLSVPSGLGPAPAAHMIPPERISPLFESLFIRSRGVVDINSASEGEVSIGAIGGGLLTLSLAYMGNQPDFKAYEGFVRPQLPDDEPPSQAKIPSIDHMRAMAEFYGGYTEHGMHGNFSPDKPPFGILFEYHEQSLSWEAVAKLLKTKIGVLFDAVAPQGWDTGAGKQTTQTPRFYSLAQTPGGLADPAPINRPSTSSAPSGPAQPVPVEQAERRWSRPAYRPEVGDRILEINGRAVRNFNDYHQAVKSSPPVMTFVLWEARTGKKFLFRTQLNPPGADSRFGVGGENAPGGGVRVSFVMQGYPGTRCQLAE
ncbi:MAG TPA: hypothetical protein VJL29_11820 [Thermoguttaceae bacterium]|nr:hypothetical protein [Thermoguttaceae bacterium]